MIDKHGVANSNDSDHGKVLGLGDCQFDLVCLEKEGGTFFLYLRYLPALQ